MSYTHIHKYTAAVIIIIIIKKNPLGTREEQQLIPVQKLFMRSHYGYNLVRRLLYVKIILHTPHRYSI